MNATALAHFSARFYVLLFSLFICTDVSASEWIKVKEQEGIEIFSRLPPDSFFREYRGEVIVNAKPDRVVRLLQNLSSVPEWHYATEQVETIRSLGMTDALVRIIIAPPWPLKKRDVVAKVSLTLDDENELIRITMRDQPDEMPTVPEFERVKRLEAQWVIRAASESTSLIQYQTHTDPGGKIPIWFYNNVGMDVPLFTLLELRRQFARESAS